MFTNFSIGGLTVSGLTGQITGFMSNPFIAGALLALLALPFAVRIASVIKMIVGGGDVYIAQFLEGQFGVDDDEYGAGETWHERLYRHSLGPPDD